MRTEKEGSTLKIGVDSLRNYMFNHGMAEVTMPDLSGLELSGASTGRVNATGRLNVDARGPQRPGTWAVLYRRR